MKRFFEFSFLWIAGAGLLAQAQQKPAITAVLDAAAYTSNIAQGSVFVVKGTNLSGAGYVPASVPYPASLNNVKITFTPTGGGPPTDAFIAYLYNVSGVNQLAAILPSTVAPGSYNVTVTNNGAVSDPFKATVVARKFGVITADGTGTGAAIVQNYISATQVDLNRFTTGTLSGVTISPAHPGQTLIVYGTGIGGVKVADNDNPGAIDFSGSVPVQVIVGNQSFAPAYAGRAPTLPGTDVIIFTLPNNVQTGCTVNFQVSVAGQLSNPSTISIAPGTADACVSPNYSKDVLTRLDQGGSIVTGNFALTSMNSSLTVPGFGPITARIESAAGSFGSYSGAQLASASAFLNPAGTCSVYHRTGNQNSVIYGGAATNLDAGDPLTLNGPNIKNQSLKRQVDNSYSLSLGTAITGLTLPPGVTLPPGFSSTPQITPGAYTLAGSGGKDVKAFSATVNLNNPIALSGTLPATVSRSQDLKLNWTGGNSGDLVEVLGSSGTIVGGDTSNPVYDAFTFICTAQASAGTITVPASVLSQLPVTPSDTTGSGVLIMLSTTTPAANNGLFTAPLAAGGNIDGGTFVGTIGFLGQTLYQ